jgi:CBS domain containing-hemolysin-like protein
MMHRTKIEAAQVNTAVPDLLKLAIAAGYSRIPLYKETVDDIVGFVHIKDVFRLHVQGQTDVKTILREVAYVPETMPVIELWELLNTRRKYVAIVFDEYGGTAGLITFEDLIEEIFGELQDEFDDDEAAPYSRDKEGRIYLRGDLLVDDVNEYWGLNLPSESADTLSGLIFSRLERKPQVGDDVIFDNIIMHVETIEDQAVSEVSMTIPTSDLGDPFIEWEVVDHD